MTTRIRNLTLVALAAACAAPAPAALITYAAHDLGAQEPDLWQLDYVVSEHHLQVNEGFQVLFPYGLYDELALVTAEPGWDALVVQPDLIFGVPEPGALDGLQLVDTGGAPAAFSMQLKWFGGGVPQPQDFELYNANYEVLAVGQTVLIPEPAAALALVLSVLVTWRRR